MEANLSLIIHNVGMSISGVTAIILAIFILLNNRNKVANITFSLMMVSVAVFVFSHIAGVSVADPHLSRAILTLNVSVIFIAMFNTHCVLALLDLEKKRRLVLTVIYLLGIGLSLIYLLIPETFLDLSVPKMYFPNYYVPGPWHWLFRALFNILVPIYFMGELLYAYYKSDSRVERNRYLYFVAALVLGWGVGFTPIYLVYDIQINPAFGSPFIFLYALPFVYALVQYELMDIRVVAKKAFWYALAIVGLGLLIFLLNLSNQIIAESYSIPFFVTPLISAVLIVGIGIVIWRRLREGDLLKYEFITVATHKFRTPLTRINWTLENLIEAAPPENQMAQLQQIKSDSSKLVELTDLLVTVSESEAASYTYHLERQDLGLAVSEILSIEKPVATAKGVSIVEQIQKEVWASFDASRIKFVIRMMLENAIRYTPEGKSITVSAFTADDRVMFSVRDEGIGIAPEEVGLVFSKFFRSRGAKLADTEGMGVGLFISREIITRHGGKIWAESPGIGKGSTFAFSLPRTTKDLQ